MTHKVEKDKRSPFGEWRMDVYVQPQLNHKVTLNFGGPMTGTVLNLDKIRVVHMSLVGMEADSARVFIWAEGYKGESATIVESWARPYWYDGVIFAMARVGAAITTGGISNVYMPLNEWYNMKEFYEDE